ncbi:MAG: DUF1553 domain-containing protein [Lentisphaerae bacterium]|nr:DUF1553 domain-containing protein [Lentisphaerota bacterium]MBR2872424.1 DUF1553 domain-containing protein [Lentisphaeria bacterium]
MKNLLTTAFLVTVMCCSLRGADFSEDLAEFNAELAKSWKKHDLIPAPVIDDAAFFRRLSLRVKGKLPVIAELKQFIADKAPDKRRKLIDAFLASEEFAQLMAMRYADMFRIKSEFPINLWPNAVQCYHRYFYLLTRDDLSWRKTARELLTASGSNFRIPASNFFRANADRTPKGLAAGTALALMNFRTDKMSKEDQQSFALFFSRVRFKSTKEWKEEIVYTAPEAVILKCRTPDGRNFTVNTAKEDPRVVFADWLCDKNNPILSRAYVNRAWYWMTGIGLANPVDDMALPRGFWEALSAAPRPNDPADENIMKFLVRYFEKNNCSTKALYRLILNSRAWQADWRSKAKELAAKEKYLAVYPVRRLESEIINDALASLTGSHERYVSVIPEPFTFIPRGSAAVTLADGSMSTGTLDKFGRSPRDSGKISERNNNSTGAQRLHLMNSGVLYRQLASLPGRFFKGGRLSWNSQLDTAYMAVLSRYPTAAEKKAAKTYFDKLPSRDRWKFWHELFWTLVNTGEFSYHH